MNLKEASTYFDGVTRFKDNSFQCKCPVHHDHTASMTVSKGKKGILIHCHAGCETKSILEAVGLCESDLFYDNNVTKVKQDWKDRLEHSKKKKVLIFIITRTKKAVTYIARSVLKRIKTVRKKCCTGFWTRGKTGLHMD